MTLEAKLFERAIPLAYRLLGKPQLRIFAELVARERWSTDQLAAYRLRELQRLVAHAATRVPYYRALFARIGAAPGDIKTFDDYAKLPLLTKPLIREHLAALCAEAQDAMYSTPTGGSTGVPMMFFHTRQFRDVASAAWFRNYLWTGLPLGARKFYLWGHPTDNAAAKQVRRKFEAWLHRRIYFDAFEVTRDKVASWLRELAEFRPEFGYGFVSSFMATCRFIHELGGSVRGMRAIMTTAETLDPQRRKIIETTFGARVFNQYGSREVWSLASECTHGSMHANSDVHHLELVDLGSGTPNVVVTPLHNYGMPLLRYVNDDLASPIAGACGCGRPFARMSNIDGRTSDNFKTPDGRVIHGQKLTHMMYGVEGVSQFQFVQTALDKVTLSLVREPSFSEAQLTRVADEFRGVMGFPLEVRFVDDIPVAASGKRRFTISSMWS